jgi:hypothetical protein
MKDYVPEALIYTTGVVTVVLAIIAAVYFGVNASSERSTEEMKACVAVGKQWVYSSCIGVENGR